MKAYANTSTDDRHLACLHVERHRLGNGLRVVLNPDPTLPIASINLWYHVGSRHDPPQRSGMAHLLEHMLFQGSRGNEYLRRIHRIGGTANGSTWYDRTNYFETFPSHALELALRLEADRMRLLPPLSAERLDVQRTVVLNERHQTLDMRPYGGAHERLHELLFPPGHPYRWPVIGSPQGIEQIRLEELQGFFRTFYAPQNAVITVAGDFSPDTALDCIERCFGGIEGDAAPAAAVPPTPDALPGRGHMHQPVDLVRVYFGFRLPPYGTSHWYAADLLAAALAAGKSSMLHRELVHRRQWALDVSYSVMPAEWCGTLTLAVACRPGVETAWIEDFVLSSLEQFAAESPSDALLTRCRNRVLTQFFRDLQPLEKRADALSKLTTYFDDPDLLAREVELYRRLGPEDLTAIAAHHLRREQAAILTYAPQRPGA